MVAMVAASWGERADGLLQSARAACEVSSKLKQLRQLKEVLLNRDTSLLAEFVTRLAELQSERASPIRKFLAEMIGDIGSKHTDVLHEMLPCLISFLEDETPAVARQAITTGTALFGHVLEKLVIQACFFGLYSNDIDVSLKSSWTWMLQFKTTVVHTAFQSGSDGVRLLAVKFVETLVLLYTPDPYISSDPPQESDFDVGFNISWLRVGHALLNVGELAVEASQSLGLLLDQLRFPQVKTLSNSMVIVLIKRHYHGGNSPPSAIAIAVAAVLSPRRIWMGRGILKASPKPCKGLGGVAWDQTRLLGPMTCPDVLHSLDDMSDLLYGRNRVRWVLGMYTPNIPHYTLMFSGTTEMCLSAVCILGISFIFIFYNIFLFPVSLAGLMFSASLSAIAVKRPSFYGRILPILLGLDPAISVVSAQVPGSHHALKNAFVACLKCTHSSAEPWRARLTEALKAIDTGESIDQATKMKYREFSISTQNSLPGKGDNSSMHTCDEPSSDLANKRLTAEVSNDLLHDDVTSSKRIRLSSDMEQDLPEESSKLSADQVEDKLPLVDSVPNKDKSPGPVQQLVAMFGALVSQGEKAAGSLDILTASISSDLLAEVVISNMQHLPPICPSMDKEGSSSSKMVYSSVLPTVQLPSLVSDIRSLSSLNPLLASLLVPPSLSCDVDLQKNHQNDDEEMTDRTQTTLADGSATIAPSFPASVLPLPHVAEHGHSAVSSIVNSEMDERKIPGVDSTNSSDEIQESHDASHSSIPELIETSQDLITGLGNTLPSNILSAESLVSDVTGAQSTGVINPDTCQATSTSSIATSFQYVLPKMIIMDANLTDESKDQLQKEAFIRVLDAYKQAAGSGDSITRRSLLAHLGMEFPLELDPWGLLQKHIVSDYLEHEGHELTLHILYRLHRETEQDQDFLSSRTAVSIYETFLLTVAESIRDNFPATDKSLSRLLVEVPYLSEGVLKLLEGLCSPDRIEKHEKDFQSGDRVTQGLSAVWNLILLRPSSRARCLLVALQSTVHPTEEVRMKATRLVANKLFSMSSISQKIEDFAREKLHSVIEDVPVMVHMEDEELSSELQEEAGVRKKSNEGLKSDSGVMSTTQLDQSVMSSLTMEAQRCMSLYFALCTKKRSLLREIFVIYKSISKAAKEAVRLQIPILVRTIGSSSELLRIISDPPVGSENLLMQVLHTLTDGIVPSQELVSSVKKLYHSRTKDVEILIPVLPFLLKDEILPTFPQLVNLPREKFEDALSRVLKGSPKTGPCLTPAEVLIAIHLIDPEKDGIPLKQITDACTTCFKQHNTFTQQVLAKVLNQLVEQIPLPMLFMRTVIQAVATFPSLMDFVMEILSRLINKQIWKYPKLWVGFLKCAIQMKPQSFTVLLQQLAPDASQYCTYDIAKLYQSDALELLRFMHLHMARMLHSGTKRCREGRQAFLKQRVACRKRVALLQISKVTMACKCYFMFISERVAHTGHKLPAAQLENALKKNPVLKPPLVEHANQPNIRSTLPRSTLVVLGLVQDSQASSQAQTSQSQAADTGSSNADAATEVTQESAAISSG
ncbi:hypothetical protein ZIOFF_013488 [Zingiber officinale]|uniref:Symplekin n=1 Tax=Zingiber officinale TaxID=94328 RepID=A0A8J5HUG3_ZINOF|nr:hypothetical protein ZIOFF_013488 [Zingiber officinale]